MKSFLDFLLAIIFILLLAIPMVLIAIAVRITSKGSILFWSDRVGRNNKLFKMPKFRTMLIDTPNVASHLLGNPNLYLSPIGRFLRRFSLDELPQLILVLSGEMSLIGPRPALFNQEDLIALRTDMGVEKLLPGITGWAQVNTSYGASVDESLLKLQYDLYYIKHRNIFLDLNIVIKTLSTVLFFRGQ